MNSGEFFGAGVAGHRGVAGDTKNTNESRWRAAIRAASVSLVAMAAMAASVAFAATTTVSVLIDSDNNVGTGCTISTANGPFAGVDRVVNTLVVSDANGYRITSITMQSCVGSSLNAPTLFDASSTPLARGNGVNGTTAVETYLPNLYLPALGQKMRVAVTTTGADGLVGTDALTLTAGGPILVDGPPLFIVPTLAKMSLALTALLLALSVWFARRRGWHGLQMVFVAAFALSISGQLIAAIVRDGFIVDWSGIPAAAVDPAGDSPAGTDITNLYSTVENGNVFFRVDTVLNAPPVAIPQSVVAVVGQSVPITLTGADYEASPLTFTVTTPPTQGVLTGTAPNLTYTPNANATTSDSFTFTANDGLLDSAPATVSIDIKRPPTITSANSTVFIPGQANSFSFTATGVPPATFALSACAPALPASISFTNNGNNTATLAGNPTVGQGGTYVCTLTASNGFGTNATQPFTLNVGLPPTFTSAANTTFTVGTAGSFTVTTTATPATTGITQTGALPSGVSFVYNGPGTPLTATLAGTPAANTGGTYPITLTAANGIPPNTVQSFTLTVNQTPAVTSANSTTCTVGVVCTFTVTASGFPVSAIGRTGTLPTGMSYVDNANGTGTLSGTPALGTVAGYPLTFTPANGVGSPAAQSFTLTVVKANQTISYTSTAPVAASVGGPTYTVTATATSTLAPAFTIDASATTVCSIAGSTVTVIGVGTCVINANQPGNADFNAAPQVQQSFAVVKGSQTISFTSTAPATAKVAGSTYTVTATASPSGLPVAFAIDAAATSVCSISGATVSFLTVGTCVINANQVGNASYNAAPQVPQSFLVAKGDQTISFTSAAPLAAKVSGPTYTVTATATPSGLPVVLTIDATATAVCSISGATVSMLTVGTCLINANQVGSVNYNAAPQVQQSFAVAKGDQTLTFTSTAPVAASVAGPTYTVTAAAAPSGLAVVFTIDASATSVCSIAGSTVSFTTPGTCVINANQAGNANYNAATQVQQSFAVAKGSQTISFTSTAPVAASVGGPTYTVTATATSGLVPAFIIDATAAAVCSIAGSTVSVIGAGTCVINANQPGNANYNAAPQVQQSFVVAKANQTVSFTSTAPVAASVAGATYTVTATATSGLTPVFTIDGTATAICSIAGSTVSFIGVGTCVLNANQPGSANYNAAAQVQQSFAVAKGNQTISFTSAAPVSAAPGGPTYTVTATATSGLAVTLTIDATAAAVCSISGSTVSFTTPGTCVINANQAGSVNFNAALQVQQSFTVSKLNQTISYTSTAPVAAAVSGATYTVTATASSGLTPTFTIDPAAAAVCTISGSTVSFSGVGTCVINANQAGNSTYFAAPQVQQSFAVAKGNQTISFTSTAPSNASIGGSTYTAAATATSGLPVSFTIAAPSASVCTISGATVSFIGAGTCTINANQAGNANFNAAPQVQQSFSVFQAPAITSAAAVSFTSTVAGTFTVTTTGFPTGASMAISQTGALPSGVTFANNNDGTATLAGTPAAGTQGAWPIVITANNGVAPNATQNFTLTVLNLAPQVIALPKETFDTVGNTQLEFRGAATLPVGFFVSGNLVANFTDADGPAALSAVAVVAGATTNGGTVNIATNGEFLFTPKAGDLAATDTFNYQVTDGVTPVTRTVTINRVGRIVYVKNNFGSAGSGRSHDPYNTLAAAVTASAVGDTIYVYNGDNTNTNQNTGVVMKNSQRLIGQGVALTALGTVNGAVNPLLIAAGTHAKIGNLASGSGAGIEVNEVTGVTVRGVEIVSTSGGGFGLYMHTSAALSNASAAISDNRFTAASASNAIRVDQGSTGSTTLSVDNNVIAGGATGFAANVSLGTGYITSFQNNSVTQPTGSGGTISGFTFDATPGGAYQTVSCGTLQAGTAALPLSGSGFAFPSVKGDLSCNDVLIANSAGTGLVVSSTNNFNAAAGTGFRFAVAAGGANRRIGSTGNAAVDVSGVDISLPLAFVGSTNSAGPGVSLVNARGGFGSTAFSASSGAITRAAGATGNAFNVDGGNGNVTYSGAITSSSNKSANIVNRTGDTVSLSGAIADTGTGLNMTNNTGATINFTGAITSSSGANTAFNATGGGTVTATDTSSTLSTSTGTALNVANTTIGVSGLRFRSISANGASNGIVLNNTGAGGLTVTGTGATAGSGGTIQNISGRGVSVISAQNINLSNMNITNTATSPGAPCGSAAVAGANTGCNAAVHLNTVSGVTLDRVNMTTSGQQGVNGIDVTNFSLTNSALSGLGNGPDEDGLHFHNMLGTNVITNTTITSSGDDNVNVQNLSSTASTLTISGASSFNTGVQGSGLLFGARNSANLTVNVTGATINNNFSGGIVADGFDTATLVLRATSNTITNNNDGVQVSANNGSSSFDINNNTFTGNDFVAITLLKAAFSTAGTLQGAVRNNSITIANNVTADGIFGFQAGAGALTVAVTDNTINYAGTQRAIAFQGGQEIGAGSALNATITGNTIDVQLDGTNNAGPGILVQGTLVDNGTVANSPTTAICADIGGGTLSLRNNLTHSLGGGPVVGGDIRVRQRFWSTWRLPGYAGAATDGPAVETYLSGRNTVVNAPTASVGTTGYAGGAACTAPIIP